MTLDKSISFFNSYTSKKERFIPENPNQVRIYSCGPTVYNLNHIGNLRSYMFVDVLRRTLKLFGYGLDQTMNITDIDDKIIRESIEKKISIEDFTAPWIEAFFEDLKTLRIEKLEHYPKATESIEEMMDIIDHLKQNGYVYEKEGSVYFSISHFKEYGNLSKLDKTGLMSGARYDEDEYQKDDLRDFVLWKSPKIDGEKFYETRHGRGRPGWHLECSAMIRKIYGKGIDLHTGGIDLLFPHHENEIAQSVCAFPNEKFVNMWLHCEHLLVEGQKMSKSLGNFYTLRDLLNKGISPLSIRFLYLSFHYRTKLNFSIQRLDEAQKSFQRIQNTLDRLLETTEFEGIHEIPEGYAKNAYDEFLDAIADDLNTPKALGQLFEFLKEINVSLDKDLLTSEHKKDILAYFMRVNDLLDVLNFEKSDLKDNEIDSLIEERSRAKADKNFKRADEIRDLLLEKGIILEDTKTGVKWKRK